MPFYIRVPSPINPVHCITQTEEPDTEIFQVAKAQRAILMTKDSDFVDLVERLGSPPQIIWLTCGNTSNARLREILSETLPRALELLAAGETLVEISGD
ncbi:MULTISPECIES: DUF5615 family PIN-like protein [unclassified Microcystis]|uniref:DUF5615 family PIN-like protein n=1 Tax=unclassified Microcystis TaxID=2643300 RepID=UPI00258DA309|nr:MULTISPECIES: DUF5615 family PIN-like protein [unclassified Microcystis]